MRGERPTVKRRGIILVMADAPDNPEFVAWLHGPHMDEVKTTPGITRITRYEVIDGPPDRRQYVGILETEDLDATIAWRKSPESRRSQEEANRRGIRNRYALVCRPVYSSVDDGSDHA